MNNSGLIKRTKRKKNYTNIDNKVLISKNLSFEAKGFLCYIIMLPDDWILHKNVVMKEFKIGRVYLDRIFDELEREGYMVSTEMVKTSEGKFEGKSYHFYEECIFKTDVDLQHPTDVDLPLSVNQHLQNTNIQTTKKEIRKKVEIAPEMLQLFKSFRDQYKGRKRGLEVEFYNFQKKHKDWIEVLPLLEPAIKLQNQHRAKLNAAGRFVPNCKNMKTWVNGRYWEEEAEEGVLLNNIPFGRTIN